MRTSIFAGLKGEGFAKAAAAAEAAYWATVESDQSAPQYVALPHPTETEYQLSE